MDSSIKKLSKYKKYLISKNILKNDIDKGIKMLDNMYKLHSDILNGADIELNYTTCLQERERALDVLKNVLYSIPVVKNKLLERSYLNILEEIELLSYNLLRGLELEKGIEERLSIENPVGINKLSDNRYNIY